MAYHVFLTGRKQVGKSTLIQKILHSYQGTIGGFFTIRTNAFLQNTYSVHLLQAGTRSCLSEENLLFICKKADRNTAGRFNHLGCAALSANQGASLIVMDELGPHEGEASLFRNAVLQALDGTVPVLGVLQEADSVFLNVIKQHPKVQVFKVTEENRTEQELFDAVLRCLFDIHSEL